MKITIRLSQEKFDWNNPEVQDKAATQKLLDRACAEYYVVKDHTYYYYSFLERQQFYFYHDRLIEDFQPTEEDTGFNAYIKEIQLFVVDHGIEMLFFMDRIYPDWYNPDDRCDCDDCKNGDVPF